MIKIKRIYETASEDDGYRIFIDRLWARGISKGDAKIDLWFKEIAPTPALRKWFNHEAEKWDEFRKRYKEELMANEYFLKQIKELESKHHTITLLYAAKDTEHSHAKVLEAVLKE